MDRRDSTKILSYVALDLYYCMGCLISTFILEEKISRLRKGSWTEGEVCVI